MGVCLSRKLGHAVWILKEQGSLSPGWGYSILFSGTRPKGNWGEWKCAAVERGKGVNRREIRDGLNCLFAGWRDFEKWNGRWDLLLAFLSTFSPTGNYESFIFKTWYVHKTRKNKKLIFLTRLFFENNSKTSDKFRENFFNKKRIRKIFTSPPYVI